MFEIRGTPPNRVVAMSGIRNINGIHTVAHEHFEMLLFLRAGQESQPGAWFSLPMHPMSAQQSLILGQAF